MHPQTYPFAWIYPVLGCDSPPPLTTTTLLKPASLHEFTQVCTSSPPPLFTDLHTFYAFFIRTQFKIIGCAPPTPSGSGPAYITISSLLLQLRSETRWAPSKSYHSREIMLLNEQSLHTKTEMTIGFSFKWNISLSRGIARVITFRIDLLYLHLGNSELSATREHSNTHKL